MARTPVCSNYLQQLSDHVHYKALGNVANGCANVKLIAGRRDPPENSEPKILLVKTIRHISVKVKVKVKFTLEQATKTQSSSRRIHVALLLLQPQRYMGIGG
jgi:hypothetical protein